MRHRRTFIKQVAAAGVAGALPEAQASNRVVRPAPDKKIWACLLHLSFNFAITIDKFGGIRKAFEVDQGVWNAALQKMVEQGMNMVLINLDDSVRWSSHPEIAVQDAWPPARLRKELDRIRSMGLEPIPMLNFSTSHDAWLGKYAYMISTAEYYGVCKDLIAEAIQIFGQPRYFHLGMDEETARHQRDFRHVVLRQKDLWWHDLYFLLEQVEKGGARPWVWSDYIWHNEQVFLEKMPKSVVQSNWYYEESFSEGLSADNRNYVKAYTTLESHGYDQIPTGSYHKNNEKSFINTLKHCSEVVADARLLGYLQTFWKPVTPEYRERILNGIGLAGEARKWNAARAAVGAPSRRGD